MNSTLLKLRKYCSSQWVVNSLAQHIVNAKKVGILRVWLHLSRVSPRVQSDIIRLYNICVLRIFVPILLFYHLYLP